MRKHIGKLVLILLLTSALLLPATANAEVEEDCAEYTWNLDSEVGPGDTKYMEDANGPKTQTGTVTIMTGDSNKVMWVSDMVASPDAVTFTEGNWILRLYKDESEEDGFFSCTCDAFFNCTSCIAVDIGAYDDDDGIVETFATDLVVCGADASGASYVEVRISVDSEEVQTGDRLFLQITNNCDDAYTIKTNNGLSWLSTPCACPGGFVPETTTIILLSAGLLGLGGFVWFKRRNMILTGEAA